MAENDAAEATDTHSVPAAAGGSSFGFVAAALVATASLLVAGFCTVRWAIVDVPLTTEQHIAEYAEAYRSSSPASLIHEFEDMEKRGLELPARYNYKTLEVNKATWGRNALVAAAIAALAILIAAVLSITGKKAGEA